MDIAQARIRKEDETIRLQGEAGEYTAVSTGGTISFRGIFRFGVRVVNESGLFESQDEVHVYARSFPHVPHFQDGVRYMGTRAVGYTGKRYRVATWFYAENGTRYRIVLVPDITA